MFLQQMFAVYGTGREGQASAAGAGDQEALYEESTALRGGAEWQSVPAGR